MKIVFLCTFAIIACGLQAATYYVNDARPDDSGDGTSWSKAKKTIQTAVNLTINGDTVIVTNGVYKTGTTPTPGYLLNNRVVITNAITVRSVSGPDFTIIEGSGTNWFNTSSAVRCVYMKRGVLDGFTLRNGTTFNSGSGNSPEYERSGGGANMYNSIAGTIITNCFITGCHAYIGGGSHYGTLNNCTIFGNSSSDDGGGAYNGTLNNCNISSNSAAPVGWGGGSYNATLNNCTIFGNSAAAGGGLHSGTLSNCTVSGNSAITDGGGSRSGTLNNCTVSGNSATTGGGSHSATMNNCTIFGNSASLKASGSYSGTLKNCIVWGNMRSDGSTNNYELSTFYFSCSIPLPTNGVANIDADPLLVDSVSLKLRLGSPCIDSGDNIYTNLPTDIAGNPRVQNETVDMGAYEGGVTAVSQPLITPPSGTRFTNTATVFVSCATDGATTYYTLDGTEPTELSTLYTDPLQLDETFSTNGVINLRVRAFKTGMDSAQETATYTLYAATPVFEPPTGTVSTNSLIFSISCIYSNAEIRYTNNGTTPTASSALYTIPVQITQSATVKAKAFSGGLAESVTATATYTIIQTVATPTIAPTSGKVATNSLIFNLTCMTSGASIRYTTDGSEPTSTSTLYSSPRTLTQSAIVKAKAFYSGMVESATAEATYTVLQTVATPTMLPADGTAFSLLRKISMFCSTSGAEIHYTVDGSIPTRSSLLYTSPFNISETTMFKLKAFKDGFVDSQTVTATYYRLSPLSDAVDATNLLITTACSTGGTNVWFFQTVVTHDNIDSAQSGGINNYQQTWMETSVTGPGLLSFWWKTSCEDDPDVDNWDYLSLSIDAVEKKRIDGITDWAKVEYLIDPGTHIIRWTYVKDESLSVGNDCGWVDQLSFGTGPYMTSTTPIPVPYSWFDQFPILLSLTGGNYDIAAFSDSDNDGYTAWEEYVAGTVPTNGLSKFHALIENGDGYPLISWTPDLRPDRVYTVEGKTNLIDETWGPTNQATRFFRVRVDIP